MAVGAMDLPIWKGDCLRLKPMLAVVGREQDVALEGERWAFERKYDGIRCIACVESDGRVVLLSRNGIDKTLQFPETSHALGRWAPMVGPFVLDGELVALRDDRTPASFSRLQQRLPRVGRWSPPRDATMPLPEVRFIAFDLLRLQDRDLRTQPFGIRRHALELMFAQRPAEIAPQVSLAESWVGNGHGAWARAKAEGWEGLVVKDRTAAYANGARSPAWRKLKILQRQTFVIGGFTRARSSDREFGALVLGTLQPDGRLEPVGSVGTGFTEHTMRELYERLAQLEEKDSPFASPPTLMAPVRWVRPLLAADVQFVEWTPTRQLRHAVYLGWNAVAATGARTPPPRKPRARKQQQDTVIEVTAADDTAHVTSALIDLLADVERDDRNARILLPGGHKLSVAKLAKPFWPGLRLTKGDLFRYYISISPYILPVVRDRPLVMRRHPDGADAGEPFYQHRAPHPLPPGARAESLPDDDVPSRLVGGDLYTLLYMVQLASISQDPWFSRVQSPAMAEEVAFDLDPMPGVGFDKVRDVALWLHEALDKLRVQHFLKTSGSTGLHIFVPLAAGTPYEPARLFTQLVAATVTRKHGKVATVERMVATRGDKVYIDCLQNIQGKTLACAYSARASAFAGASTPLTWDELTPQLRPDDFTIRTMPTRLREAGDLWAGTRDSSARLSLPEVLERLAALT